MKSLTGRLALAIGLALAQRVWAGNAFEAVLIGSNEVPGPGMAEGSFAVVVRVEGTKVRLTLTPQGGHGSMAAHLHRGAAGASGKLIADFPWSDGSGRYVFASTVSDRVAVDLVANPGRYYVDVHTAAFPAGAARGQLAPRPPGSGDDSEAAETATAPPAVEALEPPRVASPGLHPGDSSSNDPHSIGLRKERIVKEEQLIVGSAPAFKTYLDPAFPLDVNATSELEIVFFASGDCTIAGSTVQILGAGTCTLEAHQPGDSSFLAAPIVDLEFPIRRADQTLDFPDVANTVVYGPTEVPLFATASSGLPIYYAASGPCDVVGSTLRVFDSGVCSVTAMQGGGRNFNAAPNVTRTVSVYVPPPPPTSP